MQVTILVYFFFSDSDFSQMLVEFIGSLVSAGNTAHHVSMPM